MSRSRAQLLVTTGVISLMLALPLAADATTGTQTDLHAKVTITNKGTFWTPATAPRHSAKTGTTVQIKVVNEGPGRHWFRLGTLQTRLLAKGATSTFYYSFSKPGHVAWRSGPEQNLGTGKIAVVFPPTFH
ncbi:MAG TPA: hypothetical protein VGI50_05280 [Solirubrobacteraceae bacterium]|jgi:hypothetical protein